MGVPSNNKREGYRLTAELLKMEAIETIGAHLDDKREKLALIIQKSIPFIGGKRAQIAG